MLSQSNEFHLVIASIADGTAPLPNSGTTITPAENTYGSYASVLSATSDDAYVIEIEASNNNVSGQARDTLLTIGFDPAGGTSFTDTINHLLVGAASNYFSLSEGGRGICYRFPLFVKAGTSIGAKASVNNATVGTLKCRIRVFAKPTRPELMRVGKFVRTFGEVTATSKGTDVTPGTATDGTYVQLGSALAEPLWYWEFGVGINNGAVNQNAHHIDVAVGDATNKKRVIRDAFMQLRAVEVWEKHFVGEYGSGATGDLVYGRIQLGDNSASTGYSMAAYGVGG